MTIGVRVTWTSDCPDCGAPQLCDGGQSLHEDRLEWGIDYDCPACGRVLVWCGGGMGDEPPGLRPRMLAEQGHGRLELGEGSRVAALMEVRAVFGLGLAEAGPALTALSEGRYPATPPEVGLLAHRLRARGVAAEVSRRPAGE